METAIQLQQINQTTFEQLYFLKDYCSKRNKCTNCKIGRKDCRNAVNDIFADCDLSTIEIGKVASDEYIAWTTV